MWSMIYYSCNIFAFGHAFIDRLKCIKVIFLYFFCEICEYHQGQMTSLCTSLDVLVLNNAYFLFVLCRFVRVWCDLKHQFLWNEASNGSECYLLYAVICISWCRHWFFHWFSVNCTTFSTVFWLNTGKAILYDKLILNFEAYLFYWLW